jgi:hypothetical protein
VSANGRALACYFVGVTVTEHRHGHLGGLHHVDPVHRHAVYKQLRRWLAN